MTSVRMERLALSMAQMGPRSQLASLQEVEELDARLDPAIPESILGNIAYGRASSIIPYRVWDDYGRRRTVQSLPVAVIENDQLRATFLPTLGGRLWSIYDKARGRELLYQSPVIQPANLGLTNAWFAGGVEWNISTIGHSPFSFEPLHVGLFRGPDNAPALRMYELERLRETPFQIDAYLPDGSPFLFIHVRIRNPNAWSVPIYWWSNIAVPETPDSRVVAPANAAFRLSHHPELSLTSVTLPLDDGTDPSYPAAADESTSYYFDIPRDRRPWVAALDAEGKGVLHASTRRLLGRKFFTWGGSSGGQHWQAFLSEAGHPYLEIQAGLAQTQLEHVPMPAETSWSWVEAFGYVEIDRPAATGPWAGAVNALDQVIDDALPMPQLQRIEDRLISCADAPIGETLGVGSGWGALEEERRRRRAEPTLASEGMPFPATSIGPDQAPWMALLDTGSLPSADPKDAPPADVGRGWEEIIQASPVNWLTKLQLGVIWLGAGAPAKARTAWEASLRLSESAWAMCYLSVLERRENHAQRAVELLTRALQLAPDLRQLKTDLLEALLEAGRPAEALAHIDALSEAERLIGRICLLEIQASLAVGDLDRASAIFATNFVVADLREGDDILEELWYELQLRLVTGASHIAIDDDLRERIRRERPIPTNYDFRMSAT